MKIYFAADHAGFAHKEILIPYVRDLGYEVIDCGAYTYTEADDYPEFMKKAAEAVSQNPTGAMAIILGGSGQGEAIVANRCAHVRTVVYYGGNREIITLSRQHNNANTLSLGARFIDAEEAKEIVSLWLGTPFSEDERHTRRIAQIDGE